MKALRLLAQLALYAPLMAILGYFSTEPRFSAVAPDQALVRVSFIHATQRKQACRERSAEELAKLAPNMRAASVCPRERVPLAVVIELDGAPLFDTMVRPSGLAKDGSGTLYRRVEVPAGRHRVVAKLGDAPTPGFGHVGEATVDLAPGAILLIDFDAKAGGWVFRS